MHEIKEIILLLSIKLTKLTHNIREESMPKQKFKSYLITNIPERDWKLFKKWTAIEGYDTLNDALSTLIRLVGSNKDFIRKGNIFISSGTENDQTT